MDTPPGCQAKACAKRHSRIRLAGLLIEDDTAGSSINRADAEVKRLQRLLYGREGSGGVFAATDKSVYG
jgi:hypothetical protein